MDSSTTSHSSSVVADGAQYLTFGLGTEEYAVEILRVREIRSLTAITPIPNAPAHVKGFMNLRGAVVPVVGLRERCGMPSVEYGKLTVIVVLNVRAKLVGVVVDAVTDVLDIRASDVEPPPEMGAQVDVSLVKGMAKLAERLVILLDVERAVEDACRGATEMAES